jgi:CheY-like chemotaxis protein
MRGRALLVEDNRDVAEVSIAHLTELGFEVEVATHAREAMERLRSGTFDVMVSDVVMPGGVTGLDLAREARTLYPDLPILLVTGYSAVTDEAVADGFTLIRKPYDLAALAHAFESLLPSPPRGRLAVIGGSELRALS